MALPGSPDRGRDSRREPGNLRAVMGSGCFFVVGCERSGTTLLRLMLDHHPELSVPHEFDFVSEAIRADGSLPDPDDYRRFLASHASYGRSGFTLDGEAGTREQMESFLEQRRADARQVGMTAHHHFDRLRFLWPEARFVHLIRDPRAVSLSVVRMGWAGNVWGAAQWWTDAEEAWGRLAAWLPGDRGLSVRYESLVQDPTATLTEICRHLGVAYSDQMLRYPEDSPYALPDPSGAEHWRDQLGPGARRTVERRIGPLLSERGYGPGEDRPLSALRIAWLRIGDRLGRGLFAARRYGVPLWLAGVVSRRLGPRWLAERTRARVARIDQGFVLGADESR